MIYSISGSPPSLRQGPLSFNGLANKIYPAGSLQDSCQALAHQGMNPALSGGYSSGRYTSTLLLNVSAISILPAVSTDISLGYWNHPADRPSPPNSNR